jgi:hypothetical protein
MQSTHLVNPRTPKPQLHALDYSSHLVEAARNEDIRKLAHNLVADAALNGEKLKFADAYIKGKSRFN